MKSKGWETIPVLFMTKYRKHLFTLLKVILLSCTFYFVACSSSQETQEKSGEQTDTVYVFDEIPSENIFEFESPIPEIKDVYVVQIGAFSEFERAKNFAEESQQMLNTEIKVEYKQDKKLYAVWIYPPFQNKESAINYRNEIQRGGEFGDAWVTTISAKK